MPPTSHAPSPGDPGTDTIAMLNARAAAMLREHGCVDHGAYALARRAADHHAVGDHGGALACFENAARLYREAGDARGEALALGGIGVVSIDIGAFARALEWYERSLTILERLGDRTGVAVALAGIGTARFGLGRLDEALESFRRSREVAASSGDRTAERSALDAMASVLLAGGALEEAAKSARASLELALASDDARGTIAAQMMLGRVAALAGEHHVACAHFEGALEAIERTGARAELPLVLQALARSCRAVGRLDEAIEHLEASIGVRDEQFDAAVAAEVARRLACRDAAQVAASSPAHTG